jgi:C-terminal processing protease CtpA/Prc
MEERMGFARMTALSAVTALVGAAGIYALAPAVSGQEKKVVVQTPKGHDKTGAPDDGHDKGGRVIVRTIEDGGPGFDVFAMGGARVGMVVRDVETADVTKSKLAGLAWAVVTDVNEDSAAAKAGVKAGDVVTSFDGERVRSARQLERLVEETPAGRTVKMALQRAGAPVTLDVTPEAPKAAEFNPHGNMQWKEMGDLGELGPQIERQFHGQPFTFEMPAHSFEFEGEPFMMAGRGRLGVRVQDLSEELAAYFGVKSGVLVAGVEADAPAGKAGIKAGDVITAVNGTTIADPGELRQEVAKVEDGKTAELSVTRDKKPLTLKVEVTKQDRAVQSKTRRSL